MNSFYFVSMTIFASLAIGFANSQLQELKGFPHSKITRDPTGYYQTETFYPGNSGNALSQTSSQKSIIPPTIRFNPIPVPAAIPLENQPIVVSTPDEYAVDPSVVRSVQNRLRSETIPTAQTTTTTLRPISTTEPETPEELHEQAKSAYYKFGTSVRDTINDLENVRHEVREGLAVNGMYSYSDGFFRRTVHYTADEDGYRVTKEEIEPIGNGEGPKFNPKGQADVKSSLSGDYAITVDDFRLNKKQEQQVEQQRD